MVALGAKALFPLEKLSVMGFIEPLMRLPELFAIRRWLVQYFIDEPPDLFIGVDAPDFNLGLAKKLKRAGIPTVHYGSPSVWAWRQGRLKTIKQAVDLMLTLFPFEPPYYSKQNIPVKFVGHPAADKISQDIDSTAAKVKLGLQAKDVVLAIMPGSRAGELKHLAKLYLQTAILCRAVYPQLKLVLPVVSVQQQVYIQKILATMPADLQVQIIVGDSFAAMAASDLVLVTSGTATLEVMLHTRPMVIAYKTNWLTYAIVKRLIKVPYIGLPNLLAGKKIVAEFIQQQATPRALSHALLELLASPQKRQAQIADFTQLHAVLRQNASANAASAIGEMLGSSSQPCVSAELDPDLQQQSGE